MNDPRFSDAQASNLRLASWLRQVIALPATKAQEVAPGEGSLELQLDSNYHLQFYQQLPDFVMALLQNDPQAVLQYAPLLYHLAGCAECHAGYLELYDALGEAVHPQGPRPQLGQGTKTLAATPPRMLGHLCQVLIDQAEALFHQGRRDHYSYDAPARSLLVQALTISAHIGQSTIRRHALQKLVQVANLFENVAASREDDPDLYTYTPALSGAGGIRGGKKVLRHVEAPLRSPDQSAEQPFLLIQARSLEGRITQDGQTLFLHLQGLTKGLRGRYVTVTVPLGALLEPVRWRGGNPRSIPSLEPVDREGDLLMPLGETELRMSNNEERNLLEAIFTLLEVRPVD